MRAKIKGVDVEAKKDFDIRLLKLKNGKHNFAYSINASFFTLYEQSSLHDGKLEVNLELEKNEATNLLNFSLSGTVKLECDRCLDDIDYPVKSDYKLTVKISDEEQTDAENIMIIPTNNQVVNVADVIYEMIYLALPIKKLCEDVGKECNKKVIEKLKDLQSAEDSEDDSTDPRWDKLKELLN